jgi:hypothetical protein
VRWHPRSAFFSPQSGSAAPMRTRGLGMSSTASSHERPRRLRSGSSVARRATATTRTPTTRAQARPGISRCCKGTPAASCSCVVTGRSGSSDTCSGTPGTTPASRCSSPAAAVTGTSGVAGGRRESGNFRRFGPPGTKSLLWPRFSTVCRLRVGHLLASRDMQEG